MIKKHVVRLKMHQFPPQVSFSETIPSFAVFRKLHFTTT